MLDYSADETKLYVDGLLTQTGPGLVNYPSLANRLLYGFSVGSDHTGRQQARGEFDEFETFNCPLTAAEVINGYSGVLITMQPQSQTVCAASPVTFSVACAGAGPLSYQWKKNGVDLVDDGNVKGARATSLSLLNVSLSDFATYSVVVSGVQQTVTSQNAVLSQIVAVNVDIDADNNNWFDAPDQSASERAIKDSATLPGKYIPVNDGDTDGDGVPDFADGFATTSFNNEDANASAPFTPIILYVSPANLPGTTITFTYSASDPAQVTRTANGTGYTYTVASGRMRIWKKNGSALRKSTQCNSGGDFIASGVAYSLADLGLGSSISTVTLYVEGVSPTSTSPDRILVQVDPDGTGHQCISSDAVRATIDIDSDHDGLVDRWETQLGTDPHNSDTDGDGLPDGWEVKYGLNPLSGTGDDGASGDKDHDGLMNIKEFEFDSNPNDGLSGSPSWGIEYYNTDQADDGRVWFEYHPRETGILTMFSDGSDFPVQIEALVSDYVGQLTMITSAPDRLAVPVNQANSYYIGFLGQNGETGNCLFRYRLVPIRLSLVPTTGQVSTLPIQGTLHGPISVGLSSDPSHTLWSTWNNASIGTLNNSFISTAQADTLQATGQFYANPTVTLDPTHNALGLLSWEDGHRAYAATLNYTFRKNAPLVFPAGGEYNGPINVTVAEEIAWMPIQGCRSIPGGISTRMEHSELLDPPRPGIAVSEQTMANGFIQFAAGGEDYEATAGLANTLAFDSDMPQYAIRFSDGNAIVFCTGVPVFDSGPYSTDDTFRIAVDADTVRFYKNYGTDQSTLLWQTSFTDPSTFRAKCNLPEADTSIANTIISSQIKVSVDGIAWQNALDDGVLSLDQSCTLYTKATESGYQDSDQTLQTFVITSN